MIERCKVIEHLHVCTHRTEKCDHCEDIFKSRAMPSHLRQCPKVVVSCDCDFECLRDALTAHRDKDCPLVEMQCDVIGCDAKIMRGEYEKHQEQAASHHVRLLSAALSREVGMSKQEIVRLSNEVSIVKQENVRLIAAAGVLEKLVKVVSTKPIQVKWRLTDIAAKLREAAVDQKRYESPRFDVFFRGSHKLYIQAHLQGSELGLLLDDDDKSRLDIGGTSFTVTKAGLPGKKAVLPNLFLAPPSEGYGWKVLINDMRPYIDNDSINVVLDLKLNKDNETIVL